jgi:ABC-2 type transport system ATP-binding protein
VTASVALSCRGLVHRYDQDVLAVDGLDLDVRTGECFGLLGPNGAGKTTTVEILEGLLRPTAGRVEVLGRSWDDGERELRERIGVTLQETQLLDKQTVIETLRLFRSFFGRGRSPEEALELVGLVEKRDAWIRKLSGGQKQRLSVACALVGDPDLLFLDEPTTGLDPQSRRRIWEVIERFREGGGTVLLTTHYMEEAERLCDRVAIVDRGRIIARDTPAALIAGLGAEHVLEATCAPVPDAAALGAISGVREVRIDGAEVRLSADALHAVLPAVLAEFHRAGVRLEALRTHHASLEDVFVALTGRHLRDG